MDFASEQIAISLSHKQAELEIQENEKRFKALFNSSSDAIFIISNGIIHDCNGQSLKMFSCKKEQLLGVSPDKISPEIQPDGRPSSEKALEKINAALAGEPQVFEWKHSRHDGTVFDAEVNLNLVELSNEIYIQAIVRDISSRKRSEHLLQIINEAGMSMQNALTSGDIFNKVSTILKNHNYHFTYLSYNKKRETYHSKFVSFNTKLINNAENLMGVKFSDLAIPKNSAEEIIRITDNQEVVFVEKGIDILQKILPEPKIHLTEQIVKLLDLPSLILAPLIADDQVEGMITIQSDELLESDISAIIILVQQLTNALQRARHFEQAQKEIKDRLKAEKALRASEDKFSKAFYLSPDSISISSLETGKLIDVNQSFEKMFEFTKDEVIGNTTLGLNIWVNSAEREKMVELIKRDGRIRNFVAIGRAKSGENFIGEISAERIDFNNEKCIITMVRDVTERKQAEEALRESEEKFRLYMENAHDGILISGSDLKFEYANAELSKIIGYPLDEIIGQDFNYFLDEESKKILTDRFRRRQQGENIPHRYEFSIIRKDGEKRNVEISSSVIKDSKGNIKTIAHLLDISERRQLQYQLNQSQKMEAIGQLAGGVAHDFNNLLTVISGYSNLLLMKNEFSDDTKGKMEQIQKASARAEALTRQLLAFSRKQIVQPKIVDVNAILDDSLKMFNRLIGEDIQIKLKQGTDLPNILADPHQLEQILINLVVNARDAIHAQTKSSNKKLITIETEYTYLNEQYLKTHVGVNNGPHIEFSISDTGIGMNKKTVKKIFEPFFTTKEQGKGTGLGLSTVYGIVKQNQASVNVYSEPGKGTTFKIYWPISENKNEILKEKTDTVLQKGNEIILLVEDDEDVRVFSEEAITSLGYYVYQANDAQQALKLIKEEKINPHLLITDIIMPGMDGKELSQKIKKILPDIKVIFTSGYTNNHILNKGFLEKGVHFLEKPFSIAALSLKIREALNKK